MCTQKNRKKASKGRGTFWMLGGLCMIAAAIIIVLYNMKESDDAYEASMEVLPVLVEYTQEEKDKGFSNEKDPNREMPTKKIDGIDYIGELRIPAIDLDLPVISEWSYKKLKIAPCLYSGSAYKDNMVIAGHNYARHFSPIKNLPLKTDVYFTDVEGTEFHYQISNIEILKPGQVSEMTGEEEKLTDEEELEADIKAIMEGTTEEEEETKEKDWDLTLFTCTYGGQTRHTVRCKLVY